MKEHLNETNSETNPRETQVKNPAPMYWHSDEWSYFEMKRARRAKRVRIFLIVSLLVAGGVSVFLLARSKQREAVRSMAIQTADRQRLLPIGQEHWNVVLNVMETAVYDKKQYDVIRNPTGYTLDTRVHDYIVHVFRVGDSVDMILVWTDSPRVKINGRWHTIKEGKQEWDNFIDEVARVHARAVPLDKE
jgi:hypothetical protein